MRGSVDSGFLSSFRVFSFDGRGDGGEGAVEARGPTAGNGGGSTAWKGISARQRKQHVKWLGVVRSCTDWGQVIKVLEEFRGQRRWRWSTLQTAAGQIMGAVPRALYYGLPCCLPVRDSEWRDFTRRVKIEVILELGTIKQAHPASWEHVRAMIREALAKGDRELAVFLAVMWACVARPGCAILIRSAQTRVNGNRLKCRFLQGKGVTMRQRPYTIHTVLGEYGAIVQSWVETAGEFVFRQETSLDLRRRALAAMRRLDLRYEMYSFRRGAALQLQRNGASVPQIRKFTGHATDMMCERYLEWGWNDVNEQEEMSALAMALWQ